MNRNQVRMVAWLMVASLVAAVLAAIVSATGDEGGAIAGDTTSLSTAQPDTQSSQAPLGPHAIAYLCSGQDCPPPTAADVEAVGTTLDADPRVASWEYVPAEAAYQLFLEQFADDEEFASTISEDDVPAFFTVDLFDVARLDEVLSDLELIDGVAYAASNLAPGS